MSEDKARISELQGALRTKMADNKAIADSFKVEEGTVVVSTEQKTSFDKNMKDIKEIKSLIADLQAMDGTKKEVLYEKGLIHHDMGDKAAALDAFKQIYEVDYGYRDVAERVEASYS